MPRSYPGEFRRKVLDLVEAGRPVAEIAERLGVTGQTIYNWRSQDLIDRGIRPGVTTAEQVDLAAARRRIRKLETKLAVTKRANEMLREQIDPKRRFEVVDHNGVRLGERAVSADRGGCAQLEAWAQALGRVGCFGVESIGSDGAGLAGYLRRCGHRVVEVRRGDGRARRHNGKSDAGDA